MSKRPVRRLIETIDPLFNIPDGVDELVYDEDLSDDANFAEGLQERSEIIFEDEIPPPEEPEEPEEPVDDGTGKPPTPKILRIIKQKLKTLRNGDERVDVIFEVEDIIGVDKYEFRISKV